MTQIGQRVANKRAERKSVPFSCKVDKYAGFSKSNLCNFEDCNILMGVCFLLERTKHVRTISQTYLTSENFIFSLYSYNLLS